MQTLELTQVVGCTELMPTTLAFSLGKRTKSALEATACNQSCLVSCGYNPFVYAVRCAWAHHLPLVLSPDDIWICIALGFGLHLNLHAEELRELFVDHQGQATIRVECEVGEVTDVRLLWPRVFDEYSNRLGRDLGHVRDLIVADFSTTGPIERGTSQIALMSAVQPYYKYDLGFICGIPSITLLGTAADWHSIRRRAAALAVYGLSDWMSALLPILDQFCAASEGRVDHSFWSSLFRLSEGCGSSRVSGWFNTFFPYIKKDTSSWFRADSGELEPNPYLERWTDPGKYYEQGPVESQFPWGLARAPFELTYLGQERSMEFLGGFVGVSQNPSTFAVRPAIGWAVRHDTRACALG